MKNMKYTILGIVVVLITAGLLATNIYTSATGDFKCTNTEDAIINQDAKVVMASRPADQEKKDSILINYCGVHAKVCGANVTERTHQIVEICRPYR